MSTAPSTFKKNDVKRAVVSAESAGIKIGRIDIDKNGVISLYPKDESAPGRPEPTPATPSNEWDDVLGKTHA
jgi:hypothetical protein